MKNFKCILWLTFAFIMCSCGSNSSKKERDIDAIRSVSSEHVNELMAPQLLREFLLSLDNDTTGICYALVMLKQTLLRLLREETYPTQGGLEKIREGLVNRYVYGKQYIDSCINDKIENKDWLINNTINEHINPIWEQLIHE